MIFATVGSMLPFNRLIAMIDDWARRHPEHEVFAQIGEGSLEPQSIGWARMMTNSDFVSKVQESTLIVAHAGIGTVFSAMEFEKPLVLVPRYADARECANDHQIHTANWLKNRSGIVVALRDDSLDERIEQALSQRRRESKLPKHAQSDFLQRIRSAISQ